MRNVQGKVDNEQWEIARMILKAVRIAPCRARDW